MRGGYVYIMTNRKNGTLYIWVTANIHRRVWEHKYGNRAWFTKKYNLHRLVYVEQRSTILQAIQREKQIKAWSRKAKVALIHVVNPERNDLTEER